VIIDMTNLASKKVYHLMTQVIIPRPIAWVLTDNGTGTWNLAPFSYFTGICSKPPLLALSVGKKASGEKKDSWVNIEERKHFSVHIPDVAQKEAVMKTAETLPFGESEVDLAALEICPFEGTNLQRLCHTPIAMACTLHQIIEVGDGPQGLILGEIEGLYLSDEAAVKADGRIQVDPMAVNPLGRLGANYFCELGEVLKA